MGSHFTPPLIAGGAIVAPNAYLGAFGNTYYVDPTTTISGGDGSYDRPCATIAAAYALCVSGNGDKVVIVNNGTGTSTSGACVLSAALDWAKNNTHLIGDCAPTMVGQRARITGTASTGIANLITVSGSGCVFANLTIFDEYTVDPVALTVTGNRNYFYNVNVQGMGAATGGDDAAGASVKISGGQENTFENCVIGLDTVARSTTNAELELVSAATRNIFKGCVFLSFCDNAGHVFVKIDAAADIDRFVLFDNCLFYNAVDSTSTTMTNAMVVHTDCGGSVILKDCILYGATDWNSADVGNVVTNSVVPTAGTSGIAVAVTR